MSMMVETEPEIRQNSAITPEELLAMPDGGHYELIDGESSPHLRLCPAVSLGILPLR